MIDIDLFKKINDAYAHQVERILSCKPVFSKNLLQEQCP